MWSLERAHISMTLVVVGKKNTHAMTPVDTWVDCDMIILAITLVDPYVICEKNTHAKSLWLLLLKRTHMQ